MNTPWIGVIADDFTGATDVAAAVRRQGIPVELAFGVPKNPSESDGGALIVALKSRTAPAAEAVADSLEALDWLTESGAEEIYVKYCSTFDSTPTGNIGPILDAVCEALGVRTSITTPASPEHARTVYMGHLFVGDRLLSESSMATHPLTPMRDSDLIRVLAAQTRGQVALLDHERLQRSLAEQDQWLAQLEKDVVRYVVADSISEDDLDAVARLAYGSGLSSGAAGLVGALARKRRAAGGLAPVPDLQLPAGSTVVIAGSCSHTTLGQVAHAKKHLPTYQLDLSAGDASQLWEDLKKWLSEQPIDVSVMVSSSANAEERRLLGAAFGPDTGEVIEQILAQAAAHRVAMGATRVVTAGGETAGAVVKKLGITTVQVGQEADHGVPWCLTVPDPSNPGPSVALLLKSGNFGNEDLLERATRD